MFIVYENGDIKLRQGDDGKYTLTDLPTDKQYTLYLAIQDKKRNPIGAEISVAANGQSSVTFVFTPALTNLLTVPLKQDTETYYFYIKLCCAADGIEDTLILGADKTEDDLNEIIVLPKGAEGTTNG